MFLFLNQQSNDPIQKNSNPITPKLGLWRFERNTYIIKWISGWYTFANHYFMNWKELSPSQQPQHKDGSNSRSPRTSKAWPKQFYDWCWRLHGMSFLSNSLSSGEMTLGLSASMIFFKADGPALEPVVEPTEEFCGALPFPEAGLLTPDVRRWVAEGADGKLSFLSIAWTERSKRRKSDSARVRIGTSSIVLESSLTRSY